VLYDFVRLKDIDKDYKLWSRDQPVSNEDVTQSYTLGNCYFIAALSAMSTKPGLIESFFNFNSEDDLGILYDQGIASVNVYIQGVPRVINVDTLFPVTKSG